MSRGEEGRGSSFSRASRSEALSTRSSDVDLSTANRIIRAGDEAKARIEADHGEHRGNRTAARYGELLAKHGNEPTLAPGGFTTDPKDKLMAKASAAVAQKHAGRIARVERAQASMLQSGRIREGRSVNWGKGLGE